MRPPTSGRCHAAIRAISGIRPLCEQKTDDGDHFGTDAQTDCDACIDMLLEAEDERHRKAVQRLESQRA